MAAAILSQDILAVFLYCADGDIEVSLVEIIGRVEKYQQTHCRYFGISDRDLADLLYSLFFWDDRFCNAEDLSSLRLKDVIIKILEYHHAYFNDEGEHWVKDYEAYSKDIFYFFKYNEVEYECKNEMKQRMKEFFSSSGIVNLHQTSIKKFMYEMNINEVVLYHCSRPYA